MWLAMNSSGTRWLQFSQRHPASRRRLQRQHDLGEEIMLALGCSTTCTIKVLLLDILDKKYWCRWIDERTIIFIFIICATTIRAGRHVIQRCEHGGDGVCQSEDGVGQHVLVSVFLFGIEGWEVRCGAPEQERKKNISKFLWKKNKFLGTVQLQCRN